jgi:predicted amidophosphoribosyltransferase
VPTLATSAKEHGQAVLALLWPPVCPRCESRVERPRERFCEECWRRLRPLHDSEVPDLHAAFAVDSLFLEILGAGKYRGCRSVLQRLVILAAERLAHRIPSGVLVPVPLSSSRRRERGFNQSEIFARSLSKRCGLEIETKWVKRRGGGAALAGRPRAERAEAIAGKFEVVKSRFPRTNTPPLLLVDDVYTTGSTLGDCERAVLEAGGTVRAKIVLGRAFASSNDRIPTPPVAQFPVAQFPPL